MNKWRVLLNPNPDEGSGKKVETLIDDPLMAGLIEDLGGLIQKEKTTEEIKPATEKTVETPVVNTDDKKVDPPKQDEKLKPGVKKREDPEAVARRVVEEKLKNLPAPSLPEKKAEEKKVEEKPSDEGLNPDQLSELADAKFAEAEDPKFAGFESKLRKFYKDVEDYVAKERSKDPERTFDEDDAEFKRFIKSTKPSWDGKREEFRISRIADERAAKKLEKIKGEQSKEIADAKRAANEAKVSPAIESNVKKVVEDFDKDTVTEDPLETEVYSNVRSNVAAASNLYLRLIHGVEPYDPQNQAHNWVSNFVNSNAEEFSKSSSADKVRDGKSFVTPVEYAKIASSGDTQKQSKVWTYNQKDVLELIRKKGIETAKNIITHEEENAKKRGFVRQKTAAVPKQAEQPVPTSGPKAAASPAPGAGGAGHVANDHPGIELIETLGLKV